MPPSLFTHISFRRIIKFFKGGGRVMVCKDVNKRGPVLGGFYLVIQRLLQGGR